MYVENRMLQKDMESSRLLILSGHLRFSWTPMKKKKKKRRKHPAGSAPGGWRGDLAAPGCAFPRIQRDRRLQEGQVPCGKCTSLTLIQTTWDQSQNKLRSWTFYHQRLQLQGLQPRQRHRSQMSQC
ncbi:hypothetical protein JOB18_048892 [Solea senegalensis]|uniref:Uncharacterized protein n=1 Tax=Solea senegalensis TaxID=28829 RepID=A0AAV6S7I4_SOLSE|nr:hypothetical protein JOB18_048892 [Solea senegalensis]